MYKKRELITEKKKKKNIRPLTSIFILSTRKRSESQEMACH